VKTQIWIAISVYVLVAIIRKRLELDASLYQILQIFSIALFEKMPILQVFQKGISDTDLFKPLPSLEELPSRSVRIVRFTRLSFLLSE